ncbi:pentatricopeptide repeat-containing protein At2g03880, mitochondrial-like [Tripterygium wilfordii]|uniref:pentatricopeptide repeat-containing protein At2g03880, mitochondrial-like n=1 Tax=Tripterygium wilfordii TaxID=458696 RepID=UPI0018F7F741|nr:pentatricopeptide repeat-containing protein At2g03880, mitochondrial-like [Tripterygium wilfordii]XP_038681976.1 pentatricopeptide repeat-containing protein At2g03880, mitochondrial-like [Tripterygium wilfordii]XP_038681977.1 pentatricopeptide repeat-containing protein At2g03880, mitochondrial-like [Tripterygium wilfordii]
MNKLNPRKPFKCVESIRHAHRVAVSTPRIHSRFEYNRLLKDVGKSGRIDYARELFDEMSDRDEFTWNTMIASYANAGRFDEARKLFSETPLKSSITWSSLLSGYCQHGCENEAFELFWKMQIQGQRPTQYTLGSVLRLCSKLGLLQKGQLIHGYSKKTQFDTNVFVVTSLIDMYAKCNCILAAEYLFKMMPHSNNHVTWTAMITGYAQNGDGFKAIKCFRDMHAERVEPNQFTFPSVLNACAAVLASEFGLQVHVCIIRGGFEANIFVQSALVDMYVKCGDVDTAMRVLKNMKVNDVVSWNSMIVGCVRQGFMDQALSLFHKMHSTNMKVDDYTYPSVLNSLASSSDKQNAMSVHGLIVKTGYEAYKLVNNALVDMYAKQGKLDCAFNVFNQMEDKDIISWTSLVTGYAHNGSYEKALKLFCDMRTFGIYPDQIVVASILSSCAKLTVLKFGQQVHAILNKSSLGFSLSVDNSLLTMYAECGCIEDVNRVFDSMKAQNVITWTALIVGYAQNGRGKDSLQFYDRMIASGTKPDFITFIGLLFACSHAGLVDNGLEYFETMHKVYGINPGPEHYACMIDLFGRLGNLVEAKKLLNHMTTEPDAAVWKALLSACRVHGNLELGERAAKNLFELEPRNAVPYILLSNMYSTAGRWEDAARIRRLMKSKAINKEPGCSWMEVKSKVHTFMSEDKGHPRTAEIYKKIEEIMKLIKEAGYVPDLNFALHDTDEEGKEIGLAYHSEKLAIAYALLTIPEGATIRIFKNIRICGDCHAAMKYISKVYCRNIVLRDPKCFHHFTEGECSCGDYW